MTYSAPPLASQPLFKLFLLPDMLPLQPQVQTGPFQGPSLPEKQYLILGVCHQCNRLLCLVLYTSCCIFPSL